MERATSGSMDTYYSMKVSEAYRDAVGVPVLDDVCSSTLRFLQSSQMTSELHLELGLNSSQAEPTLLTCRRSRRTDHSPVITPNFRGAFGNTEQCLSLPSIPEKPQADYRTSVNLMFVRICMEIQYRYFLV